MSGKAVNKAHTQAEWPVRFAWGPTGAAACGGEAVVVVDVLSFTTTLSVAAERGVEVLPMAWGDERASAYAAAQGATLAVGRRVAGPGEVSLSPASVHAATGLRRLVLPSPNGSAISAGLAATGARVLGGSLRNASAVAALLARGTATSVTVVAAGERWPDGTLRPADEDLWGAGAVLTALCDLGVDGLSPEARAAVAAWRAVSGDEAVAAGTGPAVLLALRGCASGRELVAGGWSADVELAAEVDVTTVAPELVDGVFLPRPAAPAPESTARQEPRRDVRRGSC